MSQIIEEVQIKEQCTLVGLIDKIFDICSSFTFISNALQIIEEVQIEEQCTLVGLIDKIFDKALTDTHFSELYAKMCKAISVHPNTPKVCVCCVGLCVHASAFVVCVCVLEAKFCLCAACQNLCLQT